MELRWKLIASGAALVGVAAVGVVADNIGAEFDLNDRRVIELTAGTSKEVPRADVDRFRDLLTGAEAATDSHDASPWSPASPESPNDSPEDSPWSPASPDSPNDSPDDSPESPASPDSPNSVDS